MALKPETDEVRNNFATMQCSAGKPSDIHEDVILTQLHVVAIQTHSSKSMVRSAAAHWHDTEPKAFTQPSNSPDCDLIEQLVDVQEQA